MNGTQYLLSIAARAADVARDEAIVEYHRNARNARDAKSAEHRRRVAAQRAGRPTTRLAYTSVTPQRVSKGA